MNYPLNETFWLTTCRLYGDGFQNKEFTEVKPIPGRLVIFLSGAIDHEVCPVKDAPRVALTTWFH